MANVTKISETELAYFAGLFDGEGGIQLTRNTSGRGLEPEANVSLKISITNAHKGVLEVVQKHFGGTINSRKWLAKRQTWSTVYDLILCGKRAATFLNSIHPFVIIKAPQVKAVLVFAETLFAQWKEHHTNGGSLRLTSEGLHLRRIAFRAFRHEIEQLCGRGLQWSV